MLGIFLLLVLLIIVCAVGAVWAWERMLLVHRTAHVPTLPEVLPVIGHAHKLRGDQTQIWEYLKEISLITNKNGGLSKLYLGPTPCILVTDPELALPLMNASLDKFYVYNFGSSWLGEGLITGSGPTWKRHRKLLMPAFNQHILNGFLDIFNHQSSMLVKALSPQVGKGEFEHWPYLSVNALETICQTALGLPDTEDESLINEKYSDAMENFLDNVVHRIMTIWLHLEFVYKWSPTKDSEMKNVAVLKSLSTKVLNKRKDQTNDADVSDTKFKAFLEILLEQGKSGNLSDQEIREEVDTIIAAGHDTSSTALLYTLILLGSHPEAQERAYEEIEEVFGDSDRDVQKEDLPKLIYLEAVIKESLRLYPTVPLVAREVDTDVNVENLNLPKGSTIVLSIWGMQRGAAWGAAAGDYRPARWLDPAALPENPNAFAAFSIGKRSCIGKTYAMMSMKTTLVHLLRRYRIRADHTKLVCKFGFVLKPVAGHSISIELR
ncbi:hypothetical protein JYU34_019292 [Plutella xylostella]|uniref:Cytochrome P450 n=1 Tax=Plutella xylostella TaxID=51655 RepID=A0ABQ7PWG7_PLUXY|nr:hypothetical protein JYU34_019292 [Plutella xylostella]